MENTNNTNVYDEGTKDESQNIDNQDQDFNEDKDEDIDEGGSDNLDDSEDSDDDDDSDEDEDDEELDDEGKRKPKFVRLSRHKKTQQKLKEQKAENLRLQGLLTQQGEKDLKDSIPEMSEEDMKDLAEDFGVDPKHAKALADRIVKFGVAVALKMVDDKYGKKISQVENDSRDAKEEKQFNMDFNENLIKTLTDPEDIEFAKKNLKKIKTLAYSTDYLKKPLTLIFNKIKSDSKRKSISSPDGADGDKGKRYSGYDDISTEQLLKMDPVEADKYFESKKKAKKGL